MFNHPVLRTTPIAILSVLPATAAPGCAVALDARSAADSKGGAATLLHTSFNNAHVTLIHFEGSRYEADGKTLTHTASEVDRFLKEVGPAMPVLIKEALAKVGLPKQSEISLVNGEFDEDLFKMGGVGAIKAYKPGPVSTKALQALNASLVAICLGTYEHDGKKLSEVAGFVPFDLKISANSLPGAYTPHLSVKAPATFAAPAEPVTLRLSSACSNQLSYTPAARPRLQARDRSRPAPRHAGGAEETRTPDL